MKNTHRLLGFVCLLSVHQALPVLIKVETIKTVDDKTITFYSDKHKKTKEDEWQIHEILSFLRKCEKTNDPQYLLIEQPALLLRDIFACNSNILCLLPKGVEQTTPKLTLTTFKNLEIRHLSDAALELLSFIAPSRLDSYKERIIDNTQKTIGSLSFQDVLDEYAQIKQSLSYYYVQQGDKAVYDIYAKNITQSDIYYKNFLHYMEKSNISSETSVLDYAIENLTTFTVDYPTESLTSRESDAITKRRILTGLLLRTFVPLLDLHIIYTLLTSTHKNIIVVGGYLHMKEVRSAFETLNASLIYSAGELSPKDLNTIINEDINELMNEDINENEEDIDELIHELINKDSDEGQMLLTTDQIRKGISLQKPSLMQLYGPTFIRKAIGLVLCYLILTKVIEMVIPTNI
ncbi:hypothetical protein H0W26_01865 [Candidatus Dependentiae bacterium]|nr:hypothetical protein [Candidatus Dependentiae bacterium]